MGKRPRYSDEEDEVDVDETVRRDLLTTEDLNQKEGEQDFSDIEDEDEDEEEFSEIEGEDRGSDVQENEQRKRKKEKRNPFLDVEATVDQDEEEEEEEGYDEEEGAGEAFIEGGEDEAMDAMDLYQQILSKERAKGAFNLEGGITGDGVEDVEAEAARLRARYGRRRGVLGADGEEGDGEGGRASMRLPRVTDPKLWLVKCRPGRERDVVFHAMRHLLSGTTSQSIEEAGVLSVLSRDHVKGYVYMEAFSVTAVQSLLSRLSGQIVYRVSKVVRVPLGEMCDVLRVQRKQAPVQIGDWVRVRRGKYGGDIARILDVDIAAETARIQLVPRIAAPDSESSNTSGKGASSSSSNSRSLTASSSSASRPPRRKFNVKEVATWSRQVAKRGAYWVFQGDYFHDGFLEKDIRWTGLETSSGPLGEPITPTLEEWQLFGNTTGNPTASNNLIGGEAFSLGDRVRVKRGEWRDALGTITAIGEEDLHATIAITSKADNSKGENLSFIDKSVSVRLPLAQLRRFFQTGDAVKVVRGMHSGKQGLVVMVADTRLTLYCPQTGEQYDVLVKDTRDAGHLDTPVPYTDLKMEKLNSQSHFPSAPIEASSQVPAPHTIPRSLPASTPSTGQTFRKRRDPILGKAVVVIGGPHKGHMGIIKDVQDSRIEVELHANSTLVLLKRQHLQLKDGGRLDVAHEDEKPSSDTRFTAPFMGAMTPFIGGTTPFMGAATPFMGGGATPGRPFLPGSHTPFLGTGAKTPFMAGTRTPFMAGAKTPYGPIGGVYGSGPYGSTAFASSSWGGAKTPAASMMMHAGAHQQSFHPTTANFPPPRSPGAFYPPRSPGSLYPPRSPGTLYPPRSPGFGGSRSPGLGARTPSSFALKEPGASFGPPSTNYGPPGANYGATFGPPGTVFGQPGANFAQPPYGQPGLNSGQAPYGQPPYGQASFGPPGGMPQFGFPAAMPPPMAPWDRPNSSMVGGHRTPNAAPTMRTPASAILQAGAKTPGAN